MQKEIIWLFVLCLPATRPMRSYIIYASNLIGTIERFNHKCYERDYDFLKREIASFHNIET